jgi:SAM-dependent methyltransferase
MNTYDIYAPWYDLQNDMDDIEFYLDSLREFGGPVLDAGCGTGRLLLAFAREGFEAAGFDISQEMLERARKKIALEDSDVQNRLAISFGDMRSFQLGRKFKLGLFGCNTFQHLLTNQEQDQALQCMYQHLEEDGILLLQTTNVRFHEHDPDVLYYRGREFNPETNQWVDGSYVYHFHQHLQIMQFTLLLDILTEDDRIQRKQVVLNLRYTFPPELERILAANGFALEALYGDFSRGPITRDSPWIIAQARKRRLSI